MVSVNLKINKQAFDEWINLADVRQEDVAAEFDVDPGNFSKMLNGTIPTPKHIIEKVLGKTMLPTGRILVSEIKGGN